MWIQRFDNVAFAQERQRVEKKNKTMWPARNLRRLCWHEQADSSAHVANSVKHLAELLEETEPKQ